MKTLSILALVAAAVVAGAAIAQGIREDSLAPIWTVGWLPAVVVGALWRSSPRRRCR